MSAHRTTSRRRAARALVLLIPLALLPLALPLRETGSAGVIGGVVPPGVAAEDLAVLAPAAAVPAAAPLPAARTAADVELPRIAPVTPGSPAVKLSIRCETQPERHAATRCDVTVYLDTPGVTAPTDWTRLTTFQSVELVGGASVLVPPDRSLRIEARSSCGRYAGAVESPAPSANPLVREDLETLTSADFTEGVYPRFSVTLPLERRIDTALTLRVVAREDGEGIPHARFELSTTSKLDLLMGGSYSLQHSFGSEELLTDEHGVAQVALSSWLATYALVHPEGHSPRLVLLHDGKSALEETAVREVVLAPAAVLTGTVDAYRTGATVAARCSLASLAEAADEADWMALGAELGAASWRRSARITTEGRYELSGLPGGVDLVLHLNGLTADAQRLRTAPGGVHRVDWRVITPGKVRVRVLDEDGAPRAWTRVALVERGLLNTALDSKSGGGEFTTSDGSVTFEGVLPGSYNAVHRAEKGAEGVSDAWVDVDVGKNGATVEATLVLARGEFITGRVLDGEGLQAAAVVEATRGAWTQTLTVEDGVFRFGPLAPGEYELRASPTPELQYRGALWDDVVATVQAGAHDVEMRLVRAGAVRISWFDERGLPCTRVHTTWVRTDRPEYHGWSYSNEWCIHFAAPGVYAVLAVTDEGRATIMRDLVTRPGEVTELEATLEPAGTILVEGLQRGEIAQLVAGDTVFPATLGETRFQVPAGVYGVQRVAKPPYRGSLAHGPLDRVRHVTVRAGVPELVDLR